MTINIHCNILRFSDLNGNLFFPGIIGGSAIISKNILMTNQTYGSFEGENKVTKRVKTNPERKAFCQIRSGKREKLCAQILLPQQIIFYIVGHTIFQTCDRKIVAGFFYFIHIRFGKVLILFTQMFGQLNVFDIDRFVQ
jgi:hypothetical protein